MLITKNSYCLSICTITDKIQYILSMVWIIDHVNILIYIFTSAHWSKHWRKNNIIICLYVLICVMDLHRQWLATYVSLIYVVKIEMPFVELYTYPSCIFVYVFSTFILLIESECCWQIYINLFQTWQPSFIDICAFSQFWDSIQRQHLFCHALFELEFCLCICNTDIHKICCFIYIWTVIIFNFYNNIIADCYVICFRHACSYMRANISASLLEVT